MNFTDALTVRIWSSAQQVNNEISEQARCCLLDYAAVAIAGLKSLSNQHELAWARELFHSSASGRAFLYGLCAHRLELDDGYRLGGIHIGAPVLSTLVAGSKGRNLLWEDLCKGIVAGYEAAALSAFSACPNHKQRGFHATGTCGAIGAAAGLAVAFGYDQHRIKRTLSFAAASASGVLEMQEDGSELKPVNAGFAAMHGILSTEMGSSTLAYPVDALGGKRGALSCMADVRDEKWPNGLQLLQIYRKLYPSCRHGHSAVDAAKTVRCHPQFNFERIQEVGIATYHDAIFGHDNPSVSNTSEAMMSTPYCVATMLKKGCLTLDEFEGAAIGDEHVESISSKIILLEDEKLTDLVPNKRGARLTVLFDDGSRCTETILLPKGEPENPLTAEELEEKALSLLYWAELPLSTCKELIASIKEVMQKPERFLAMFEKTVEVMLK